MPRWDEERERAREAAPLPALFRWLVACAFFLLLACDLGEFPSVEPRSVRETADVGAAAPSAAAGACFCSAASLRAVTILRRRG